MTETLELEDDVPDEEDMEKPSKWEPGVNLVPDLARTKNGKEALKDMGGTIRGNYRTTWDSTEPSRQRVADDWKLFAGILPKKEMPFEGCANIHVPTALENITRLDLRAYDELFGDWTNVFGVVPVGPQDDQLADVLTLHMNWQLREQIRDFPRQMHRALLAFFFIGDVSGHSFYDPVLKSNRHEVLTPEDLLVPYASVTTMPDYSDVPWLIKILRLYRVDLEARTDEWSDVDKILEKPPPTFEEEPDEPLAEVATESSEQEIDSAQEARPYKLLSFEGWMKLPGDKRLRFIQAVVDPESGWVHCLKLHEQENWQDRVRFDQQMLELDAYESALAMRTQTLADIDQQKMLIQNAEDQGMGGPLNNMAMLGDLEEVEAQVPMPPAPPWLEEAEEGQPERVRMEPIRLFVHSVCIEPLKGNIGLSYGRIQADHNRAINTMVSQFVDSATFANVPAFIGGGGLQFKAAFQYKPGYINISNLPAEQVRSAIVPIQTPGPSGALFQTVEFLMHVSASSMQSPQVLSGEPGKSGEPFKGLAARIEQASKQLGTLTRKFMNEFLEPIVKNNGLLNSEFLADDELMHIVNRALGTAQEVKVGKALYKRSYGIVFRADLRFTSQTERVAEADEVLKMVDMLPPLQANPRFLYESIKGALTARGLHKFVPLLGKPPEPNQEFMPPPPPMPPGAEAGAAPPGPNGQGPPQPQPVGQA